MHKVAVVVPALAESGGVSAVAEFVCELIDESNDFEARLFSVPSSSGDPASVRLRVPSSWVEGPQVQDGSWKGRDYEHIGSVVAELEFQRYRARDALTRRLRECDLVQVVCGSPAWGVLAQEADRPLALQVATLATVERRERFRQEWGLLTTWRRVMTGITARFDRKGIRMADRVFVENRWVKETVKNWTDPAKVVLAPPGVDTEFFHPSSRSSTSGPSYILSVGRFGDRRKNVRLLFEAYADLSLRDEDRPSLVLAGMSAPRDEDWRTAEILGIGDQVRFHQNVSRSRLAELYRNATVFVLSSSEEGLGIVILEAMASGIPVVSTATQGAQEAVDDGRTGILTPVRDASSLSRAMEHLLTNPKLRDHMGRMGRLRTERRFSKDAAGKPFLDGYRELLGLKST